MPGNIGIPPFTGGQVFIFSAINRENIMSVVPVADVLQGR